MSAQEGKHTNTEKQSRTFTRDWQLRILHDAVGRPIGIRTTRRLIEATHRHGYNPSGLAVYRVAIVFLLLAATAIMLVHHLGSYDVHHWVLVPTIFIFYIGYRLDRLAWKRKLSAVLREESIRPRICLLCGYNLFGSTSSGCPECGEQLADPSTEDPESPIAEPFD